MARKRVEFETVTPEQWIGVIFALVLILVPIVLIVAYPTNRVVNIVFGEGRILIFWMSIVVIVVIYREKIDRYIAKIVSECSKQ